MSPFTWACTSFPMYNALKVMVRPLFVISEVNRHVRLPCRVLTWVHSSVPVSSAPPQPSELCRWWSSFPPSPSSPCLVPCTVSNGVIPLCALLEQMTDVNDLRFTLTL